MDPIVSPEPREGYLPNRLGDWISEAHIRPALLREHRPVEDLIEEAGNMRVFLEIFKAKCFDEISTFRAEMAATYNANVGGTRGGLTLNNFADTMRITVSQADSLSFGPELEAAKSLIDECLREWAEGGNDNLRAVVNDAFHVGENKKVRMDRVLGLRRIQINDDDRWARAMAAINDAVRTERSRLYVRLYRRATPEDEWTLIVLDLARV